jgi:predicted nucleic acid-binding protein
MILADTSIWIDHFRSSNRDLQQLLARHEIAVHPLIALELALGSLSDRARTLLLFDLLPHVRAAQTSEVRWMVETQSLYSRGIGATDAHLIASVFLTAGCLLWTKDKRLRAVAETLGIHASLL